MDPKEPTTPVAEPPVASAPTPPTGEPAAPPAEPAPATEPATTEPPAGDGDKPWTVPGDRFQQEVEKRKEAEARAAALEAQNKPPEPESDIDPETAKILDGYLAKKGYVSKSELEAQAVATRQQQDLLEVKQEFSLTDEQVRELAAEADKAGATNKQGLRNAYFATNLDSIVDQRVKERLAKGDQPTASAEAPGGSGTPTPPGKEPELNDKMSAADRIKARIQAARNK